LLNSYKTIAPYIYISLSLSLTHTHTHTHTHTRCKTKACEKEEERGREENFGGEKVASWVRDIFGRASKKARVNK
jgi:hypothetical protein